MYLLFRSQDGVSLSILCRLSPDNSDGSHLPMNCVRAMVRKAGWSRGGQAGCWSCQTVTSTCLHRQNNIIANPL